MRMCAAAREHDLRHALGNDVLGGMTVSIGIVGHRSGDNISSLFRAGRQGALLGQERRAQPGRPASN